MDRNICQQIIDTALEFELSADKVIQMLDDVEPGGLWDDNDLDEFVLDYKPVVECPACFSKLDSSERCFRCGWGITHYGEHSANFADAKRW